jgi:hypothetical protein
LHGSGCGSPGASGNPLQPWGATSTTPWTASPLTRWRYLPEKNDVGDVIGPGRKRGTLTPIVLTDGQDLRSSCLPIAAFRALLRSLEVPGRGLHPEPWCATSRISNTRAAVTGLKAAKKRWAMILAKAAPGIRFNEHMEGDCETVFRHACKLGLEGIVSKRKDFGLSLGTLARLAQNEECKCSSREARSGGGLGQAAVKQYGARPLGAARTMPHRIERSC